MIGGHGGRRPFSTTLPVEADGALVELGDQERVARLIDVAGLHLEDSGRSSPT
ncbi:MAG: hypothetical protein ACREM1_12275 [Longimicrobiales bacterium]